MDEREFDLAGLLLVRDEALAVYQAKTQRWQAVQAAALAALGVGIVAYLSSAFPGRWLLVVLGFVAVLLLFAARALDLLDRDLARELRVLRAQIERLKDERGSRP